MDLVYIVIKWYGADYEDHEEFPVKAFHNKEKATAYIEAQDQKWKPTADGCGYFIKECPLSCD